MVVIILECNLKCMVIYVFINIKKSTAASIKGSVRSFIISDG
jgi:hypothetical protein